MPPTPTTIGRYEVIEELGSGGFGRVFKCRDGDRVVAIKVLRDERLSPDAREHFLREAELARAVRHENVCPIEEVGLDGERPHLVMPFVEGGTLADRIRESPLPPLTKALDIVRDLALGLSAIHAAGIVHRDMKPQNILIRGSRFLIADFGLAKPIDETTTVAFKGTWRYMSPEQLNPGGPLRIESATDIFSLGVILYELLTGAHPFPCDLQHPVSQALAVIQKDARKPSDLRPGLDPELDRICLKALEKTPSKRHASAKAFADVITAANESQVARERQTELLAELRARAEEDFIQAENYYHGRGVPQDRARARALYESAAAQRYAPAEAHLAAEHLAWVEAGLRERSHLAAERRVQAEADYTRGNDYYFGHGVLQNYATARELYVKAASRGHIPARYYLGRMYQYGLSVRKDSALALKLYQQAAAHGYLPAQAHLEAERRLQAEADFESGKKCSDPAQAMAFYEKAAARGHAEAQTKLAYCYDQGLGVPQSYAKAHEWYEKAAAQGHAPAQTLLGKLYEYGRGVLVDSAMAREWYGKAAAQGYEYAKHTLERLNDTK